LRVLTYRTENSTNKPKFSPFLKFISVSEFEGEEGSIVRLDASSDLEKVAEALSLSGEGVDDVLVVVGGWGLEEEAQVGEDWAHLLVVDGHSGKKLTEDDHIDHQWSGKEGVLTDVVGRDGVDTIHENGGGVLIKSSLGVLNEWDILDDDLVVDVLVVLWVQNLVGSNGVIKHSSLGDLLGLEALVLLEVLSVVVTEMVVGNNRGESDT
jgi:hypothetical protein